MHEINENVRYVRHQLRVQREAYEAAAKQFRAYKTPEESVTPFEVIETLDREWGP
jgi:hypothetical protein